MLWEGKGIASREYRWLGLHTLQGGIQHREHNVQAKVHQEHAYSWEHNPGNIDKQIFITIIVIKEQLWV